MLQWSSRQCHSGLAGNVKVVQMYSYSGPEDNVTVVQKTVVQQAKLQ